MSPSPEFAEFIAIWFVGGIAGAVSAAAFILHCAFIYIQWTRDQTFSSKSYAPVRSNPVFKYRVLRILACFAFLASSVVSFTRSQACITMEKTIYLASIIYGVCLSLISVMPSPELSKTSNRHLNVLLLVFLGVYAYRDLWPLCKFNGIVVDAEEGQILWLKIASLVVAAIVIPLAVPRQAYPSNMDVFTLDSKVNSEETASLFSLLTHSYMDSLIFRAYRVSGRITMEDLPPLAKADHSDVIMPNALSILDPPPPKNRPYLFWGLLRIFRRRVCIMAGIQLLQFALGFVAPIGIKQVLSYLENGEESATIRPWVWVSWLFFGPFLKAVFAGMYTYFAGRNKVPIIGILNQLLLRHALRIRIDAGNPDGKEKSGNFSGKLNNLATSDASEVAEVSDYWIIFLCFPFELAMSLWFLYAILGWSAFIGFAFMLLCVPVPGYITQLLRGIQVTKKQKTDARVQSVTEAMRVIRMVKLFGWEKRLESQISSRRDAELSFVKKSKLYGLLNAHSNLLIPMCTMMITYGFYTAVFKKELNASVVFPSMAVFEILRVRIRTAVMKIPSLVQGKVALDRLDDFLRNTRLVDRFDAQQYLPVPFDPSVIGFRNVEFRWLGSSDEEFKLKFNGDVLFRKDCVNLIVGPTGSGKTSLLLALLGEMCFFSTGPSSYYHLPRQRGVSYAAQESWIQNDTIRNNILFGSEFDEERYNSVLYQCSLLRDLSLFEAGDMTQVGERGLTLSGGQKARVTLARAVYSSAEIVLLDDPLSTLDVHTAKWVVEKCLKGPLMQGRTVLLVTHNIALTTQIAQHVVAIALDGSIVQGAVTDVISTSSLLTAQLAENKKILEASPEPRVDEQSLGKESNKPRGGLVLAEEIDVGHVSLESLRLYLNGLSRYPVIFFWVFLSVLFLNGLTLPLQSWFLGYWSSQYESRSAYSVSVSWFLSVYAALLILSMVLYSFGFTIWTFGSLRASRIIHAQFINSIMNSTFRWLDMTPTSRIIARATADIRKIDDTVSFRLWRLTEVSIMMLVSLGSILLFAPAFLVPGIVITILGGCLGQVYLAAQLPMRRLISINQAPILGVFSAAVVGLVSIRAYGAEDAFLTESRARIDAWARPALPSNNADRWIAIRADTLAGLFTAGLGAYLVYGNSGTSAANTGFSMTMAVGFTSMILTWVRLFNAVEVEANSLERMRQYLVIEHEEMGSPEGVPPAHFPSSGALEVEGLCAKYSKDGPEVLHDLSFNVRSGERIGVVGRTGSGKSSLTLALLRAIPTSGQVFYDGIPTHGLNLDALRSNITIIPQVPELLGGTLRSNLDSFSDHDDSELNDALRSAGLFALQDEDAQNKLGLDTEIKEAGNNLSVGQRQIIALARAILRGSKLLILDEATSSIDHKTDSIIQETLRNELGPDVTLITVAHRLATVMDFDKIMVLDDGRIAEFDVPRNLLNKEGGLFRALVDESADKQELYAMVK